MLMAYPGSAKTPAVSIMRGILKVGHIHDTVTLSVFGWKFRKMVILAFASNSSDDTLHLYTSNPVRLKLSP